MLGKCTSKKVGQWSAISCVRIPDMQADVAFVQIISKSEGRVRLSAEKRVGLVTVGYMRKYFIHSKKFTLSALSSSNRMLKSLETTQRWFLILLFDRILSSSSIKP